MSNWSTIKVHHAVPVLTFASFCTVWSRSLSRSLHRCTSWNPSTISPIEILSSDLLVEWNEFGQYWRRCVERCDWIFQAILLTSTVRWAWIHDGYKTGWAPRPAVGVFKIESNLAAWVAGGGPTSSHPPPSPHFSLYMMQPVENLITKRKLSVWAASLDLVKIITPRVSACAGPSVIIFTSPVSH
jgi:hypothetical protein